jgi:putative heme iron utilization protein
MKEIKECKREVNEHSSGVLSTISLKLGGFPFGSIVPFCTDKNGFPVIYISTIAEHTKNILADPRVSLTLATVDTANVQAKGRVTIVGNIEVVEGDQEVEERYYSYFPKSRGYAAMHSFSFYRIVPKSIRFIGGFGAIHWIDENDFTEENPFWGGKEKRIASHMNKDHRNDLILYCLHYKQIEVTEKDIIQMVGVDSDGFDLLLNERKIRFNFAESITTAVEARESLVAMSKQAKTNL